MNYGIGERYAFQTEVMALALEDEREYAGSFDNEFDEWFDALIEQDDYLHMMEEE